LDDFSRFIVA
jgi:putative transposase